VSNRTLNIAHRGASAYAPENTIAAFDLALTLGADSLEMDVQMTRDGELVVIHDAELGRTTRGSAALAPAAVSQNEWPALSCLDAGSWFNDFLPAYARPEFNTLRVPLLEDVSLATAPTSITSSS
jgi:glycerophosphoryl diester phosphodiesterase